MRVYDLFSNENFDVIIKGEDDEVRDCFCSDFLSWALGYAHNVQIWFTVMGTINTVAVASLNKINCIILCHGSRFTPEALEKAKEENINIIYTDLATFNAVCLVSELMKL